MNATSIVSLFVILCLLIGYLLVRFKFYPIIYFIQSKIVRDKYLSDIENVHLKNIKQKNNLTLSVIPILGFSWGLFGITLTCFVAFNHYLNYLSVQDSTILLRVINDWLATSIILLSAIPLLFLFTKADIPIGMKRSFNRYFLAFIVVIMLFALVYSAFDYHLSLIALSFLFLLGIPCVFSSWFIGQYFAVYVIRSFYQAVGWDFVLNEKTSILGKLKGFFSLLFAILTPIIAINSLLAVIFANTSKGGFIGIWLLSLPTVNFHWTVPFIPHFTFNFTRPSFVFLASIIILFLIVGPLVTFIFRPTFIFELTLNSKIYQTLINLNWDHIQEHTAQNDDMIVIHSLTVNEMHGVILFFISFINYVAILSVGAVTASFHINLDQIIGLNLLNGTIKLIEIPILMFVEYIILHDLSEERELVHLASKGRKLAKNKLNPSEYTKKFSPKDHQKENYN